MAKGNPPPFVVARGEDRFRVLDETLKYTGFFDLLEEELDRSGKRRELFQVIAKVDMECALAKEERPLTYVDPELVSYLFNLILDRGFRLMKVAYTTNEFARFQQNRSAQELGAAIGYDESCYELVDLARDLFPVDLGSPLGKMPTGRPWKDADFRIVFAKNRTHEVFGPTLLFYNVFHTLATPTDLLAIERGIDPAAYVPSALAAMPVHFGLIDAVHSLDGTPGGYPAEGDLLYELLRDEQGEGPEGPRALETNTLIAGRDVLAVEAAGCKMQGLDPMALDTFKTIRRASAYRAPAEVDTLPVHPGWGSIGANIQRLLDIGKPVDAFKFGLQRSLESIDLGLFPRVAGGFLHVRLAEQARAFLEEVEKKHHPEAPAIDGAGI